MMKRENSEALYKEALEHIVGALTALHAPLKLWAAALQYS